jgi:uncharacterized protein (TIGR02145 family)
VQDCAGVWGGTATTDECGTCDADNSNDCVQDCAGVWGGTATTDECGTCDADNSNDCVQDCAGVWGGATEVDVLGECGGGCETDLDQDGVCDSDEIPGCQDSSACNFFLEATDDDGSCEFCSCQDAPELELASGELAGDTIVQCDGSLTLSGQSGYSYLWSTGSTESTIAVEEGGEYSLQSSLIQADVNEFALSLDGIGDYVEISTTSTELDFYGETELSICAWVNLSSDQNQVGIFTNSSAQSTNQQYAFKLDFGHPYFISGDGLFESNGFNISANAIPINTWVHLAMTYDGQTVRFYVDGELDFQNSVVGEFPQDPSDVAWIGQSFGANNANFSGAIDEVSVWNIALSQDFVQSLMNCPSTGAEIGVVGCWGFNQGTGSTVVDMSSFGNDATLIGCQYDADIPPFDCATNCVSSDTVSVVFLTPTILQSDTTICAGDSLNLGLSSGANGPGVLCDGLPLNSSLDNGLAHYFSFCGNGNDVVGGIASTFHGPEFCPDRFGTATSALFFDGSSYLELDDTFFLGQAMDELTYNVWFKMDQFPTSSGSISGKEGYWKTISLSQNTEAGISFGGSSSSTYFGVSSPADAYSLGEWHMASVTLVDGYFRLYIDAIEVGSGPCSAAFLEYQFHAAGNSTATNYIGAIHPVSTGVTNFANGYIDDFSLWSRALTSIEIESIYIHSAGSGASVLWSTGDTTATITVAPLETTTYTVTQTLNGVSCSDEVTVTVGASGCTDSTACNFDSSASCNDGSCLSIDLCGICGGDNTSCQDCAGTVNGTATTDECGTCDADNSNDCVEDCAGVWAGTATTDECGTCDADNSNDCVQDCAGVWGGATEVDVLGICGGACDVDTDQDGVCDVDEIAGCTEATACNFDSAAEFDDGSCTPSGCTEPGACNFDENAQCPGAESCDYTCCPGPGCCDDGTIWNPTTQSCIQTDAPFVIDGECTILGVQDLTILYSDLQGQIYALESQLNACCGTNEETAGTTVSSHSNGAAFSCGEPVDYDIYSYATVQIGDQCWFQENLRSEHYLNGDLIPGDLSNSIWSSTSAGAQAHFNNDAANLSAYGRLYNWYAVDDARGLCPSGWHVPSDDEYTTLTDFLGGASIAGGKMKEAGTAHWNFPNSGADNSSGFSGLGHGFRTTSGSFSSWFNVGDFWSSSPSGGSAWYRVLFSNSADVSRSSGNRNYGFAVRCTRD